jgi:hypothetical protein
MASETDFMTDSERGIPMSAEERLRAAWVEAITLPRDADALISEGARS